jgi:hypothetical protein
MKKHNAMRTRDIAIQLKLIALKTDPSAYDIRPSLDVDGVIVFSSGIPYVCLEENLT